MPVETRIQVRRDTASNWTSSNPTLASGEFGFETDTGKFKIGDGSTAWGSLVYKSETGATGPQGPAGSGVFDYGTFTLANDAVLTDEVTASLTASPAAGTFYRVTIEGQYLNNSGSNRTLRMEVAFGGSAVFTATSANLASNASARAFRAEVLVLVESSTAQRVVATGQVAATAGAASWATANQTYLGEAATSVNMSTAQNLVVRFQHSAAATTITLDGAYRVEKVTP